MMNHITYPGPRFRRGLLVLLTAAALAVSGMAVAPATATPSLSPDALGVGCPAEDPGAPEAPCEPEVPVELAASTTKLVLEPPIVPYGTQVTAHVTVSAKSGQPTGRVTIRSGDEIVGADTLWVRDTSGKVSIDLPRDMPVGKGYLRVTYEGNDQVKASSAKARLQIYLSVPKIKVKTSSWKIKKGTRPKVTVTVSGVTGAPKPIGTAVIRFGGTWVKARLSEGKATLRMPKITKRTRIKVIYYPRATGYVRDWKFHTFTIKK